MRAVLVELNEENTDLVVEGEESGVLVNEGVGAWERDGILEIDELLVNEGVSAWERVGILEIDELLDGNIILEGEIGLEVKLEEGTEVLEGNGVIERLDVEKSVFVGDCVENKLLDGDTVG